MKRHGSNVTRHFTIYTCRQYLLPIAYDSIGAPSPERDADGSTAGIAHTYQRVTPGSTETELTARGDVRTHVRRRSSRMRHTHTSTRARDMDGTYVGQ